MIANLASFLLRLEAQLLPAERFLLAFAVKAVILLLAALGFAVALQRASAATRECVWRTGFAAILVLPVLMVLLPPWNVVVPAPVTAAPPDAVRIQSPPVRAPAAKAVPTGATHGVPPLDVVAASGVEAPVEGPSAGGKIRWGAVIVATWLAGVAFCSVSLLLARRRLRILLDRATPATGDRATLEVAGATLGIRPTPALVEGPGTSLPVTAGGSWFRAPVIIVPPGFAAWDDSRRSAVLWHEMGHVLRRDAAAQSFARWIAALLWPVPLVWLALRRQRIEAERACDDLALASGMPPADYARQLVNVAAESRRGSPCASAPAMAAASGLRRRVVSILDPSRPRRAPRRGAIAAVLVPALIVLAALAAVGYSLGRAEAGGKKAGPADGDTARTAARLAARERGLEWLAKAQDEESGGWRADAGYKFNASYHAQNPGVPHAGVTALALMAFLDAGCRMDRGPHADVVAKGAAFLVSRSKSGGGYFGTGGERMNSHGVATLCLARLLGAGGGDDVDGALQAAVRLITDSQNDTGGWRYEPGTGDADTIETCFQLLALQAARNVRVPFPQSVEEKARAYLHRCYFAGPGRGHGGIRYQAKDATRASVGTTAMAALALLNYPDRDPAVTEGTLAYLDEELPKLSAGDHAHYFWWHGAWYTMQALKRAADLDPGRSAATWKQPAAIIAEDLMGSQQSDGSWKCSTGPGPAFSTAVACMLLGY